MTKICPRRGCPNILGGPALVVCSGDFHALAGMCRGKKRLGRPEADSIAAAGGGSAYQCPVCRMFHNGHLPAQRDELHEVAGLTIAALREDPRVGWRGVLELADAWHPRRVRRARWMEGLDQREAFALAS